MADAAATIPTPEPDAPDAPAAAPVADLPSGEPIPSSTPPSKTPKRRSIPLGALLAALPSNVDAFLTRLDKCLSTPSGIDTVMLLLCYTSKTGASVLSSLSQSALRRSAREWIALVASLPRGTTVVFSSPAAAGNTKATVPPVAALALLLSKRLSALSSLLSEARMILRLWALLGMYFWARGLVRRTLSKSTTTTPEKQDGSAPSRLETAIEYLRLALCVAFQALENGAYLSSRGVMGWSPARQGEAYRWSARLWGAYVGIEIGRLAAERFGPAGADGTAFAARPPHEKSEWAKKMARQLAWAPLTVHWGSEKGLVSEMTVGLLASIPGVIQMRDLWASTA
ncbi:hypothetical protein MYCTH_2304628 [Thermothelomyces thermophilus ATCC 42464]|uniref:Peroxin 11C n=1 Tax=Thermothelomyces thermophilus (strain ATCC 42464 / BCRC 31852 / DSM 1799) TaxID=573729 RepID=G2QBF3_THET4|nr:uncharacterized protein MYCTH_2304628 [Thermothelomyces thermophilus ATCC 42464]AEO57896.1 hypothetical protein MYCTH_2304628 [Thermothelomyces thermophilus ATCC 42464]